MALSDNLIEQHRIAACDSGPLHFSAAMRFARAIEAEARKQDEALLAEARAELQWWIDEHGCCAGHEEDLLDRLDARLEKAP